MRNALYRVYRPQNFDEIEGQIHVSTTLRNAAREGQFAHAYLLTGTRGTGKTSTARILAKAINCSARLPDGNPCNVCEFCLGATRGQMVDLVEIDAASNNSVDQIRTLTERALFQPAQAKKKVYIIDEVHMLSNSASNALLKTLEEPPAHVHFILATTEQHKLLATIVSRCQVFHFFPLSGEEISARLTYVAKQEKILIEPEAVRLVAQHARGGMRDALSILERLASMPGQITLEMVQDILGSSSAEQYAKLTAAILAGNVADALAQVQEAEKQGAAADKFLRGFKNALRDTLLAEATKNGISAQARRLMDLVERLEQNISQVRYADMPWLHCELAVMRACDTSAPVATLQTPAEAPHPAAPKPAVTAAPRKALVVEKEKAPKPAPLAAQVITDNAPLQRLQKEWQSFAFKVPSTIVRTALKSTKPESLDNGELTLVCQSPVQFTYLGQPDNIEEIRSALKTHYDLDVMVRARLAEAGKPAASPAPAPTQEVPQEAAASAEEQIFKIADFFGGTVTP